MLKFPWVSFLCIIHLINSAVLVQAAVRYYNGIIFNNPEPVTEKGFVLFSKMKKEDQEYFIKLMNAVSKI